MDLEYKDGCCGHGLSRKSCHIGHYCQLNTYDYLVDVPGNEQSSDVVEIQFKNTRKGYYCNTNKLPLEKGQIVAVESSPGHDIGTVTLTGKLAYLQMKKANTKGQNDLLSIYRIARPVDMEKFNEAKAKEHETMIRSRQIAKEMGLEMKIGDVEYQGDGNKAIFYYIADGRVDFRQLIKVFAEEFRVRIEMKQIGARQEAGRIGGYGSCGRELCCATWMKQFVSVSTGAARFQDLSLNPQKLAGQCAKLKCCMNYEVDQYVEAGKRLPSREVVLQTQDSDYYVFKMDVLSGMITYSTDKRLAANLVTIPAARAMAVISMNKNGEKPLSLSEVETPSNKIVDLAAQEDVNRFDKKKKKKHKSRDERRNSNEIKAKPEDSELSAIPSNSKEVEEKPKYHKENTMNGNVQSSHNKKNRYRRERGHGHSHRADAPHNEKE